MKKEKSDDNWWILPIEKYGLVFVMDIGKIDFKNVDMGYFEHRSNCKYLGKSNILNREGWLFDMYPDVKREIPVIQYVEK